MKTDRPNLALVYHEWLASVAVNNNRRRADFLPSFFTNIEGPSY